MAPQMMTYDETMAWGARQYTDVLATLREHGLPAEFTQTGGMCAALEVQLENGNTLLITDADDYLSWARAEHAGWGVGLYRPGEHTDGPLAWGANRRQRHRFAADPRPRCHVPPQRHRPDPSGRSLAGQEGHQLTSSSGGLSQLELLPSQCPARRLGPRLRRVGCGATSRSVHTRAARAQE